MNKDKDINELLAKLLEVATGLSRFQRAGVDQHELTVLLEDARLEAGAPRGGLTGIARQLLEEGKVRRQHAPGVPDHCWPLILDLYIQAIEGRRVSVTDACIAARAPNTTALRWIAELVEAGVIERAPDPGDKRRTYMSLAARTVVDVSRYLAHVAGIEAIVAQPRTDEEYQAIA